MNFSYNVSKMCVYPARAWLVAFLSIPLFWNRSSSHENKKVRSQKFAGVSDIDPAVFVKIFLSKHLLPKRSYGPHFIVTRSVVWEENSVLNVIKTMFYISGLWTWPNCSKPFLVSTSTYGLRGSCMTNLIVIRGVVLKEPLKNLIKNMI